MTNTLDKKKITHTKTWEQRFDEMIFSKKQGYGDQILYRENDIKKFISDCLASQLEEAAEGVEKIENPFDKCYEDEKYYAFNQAISDVLSYLKGEMK